MPWWWPFGKKREAEETSRQFREMLDQALLGQDDLNAATEKLRKGRTSKTTYVKKDDGGASPPIQSFSGDRNVR